MAEAMCQRPKGGKRMNKYELVLIVNAKIEDDERATAVEKANGSHSLSIGTTDIRISGQTSH